DSLETLGAISKLLESAGKPDGAFTQLIARENQCDGASESVGASMPQQNFVDNSSGTSPLGSQYSDNGDPSRPNSRVASRSAVTSKSLQSTSSSLQKEMDSETENDRFMSPATLSGRDSRNGRRDS